MLFHHFTDHTIQIYEGQKATENQWTVIVLRIVSSSHYITVSSYQYHKYKFLSLVKQYLVLVQKEQWGDFPVQSAFVST